MNSSLSRIDHCAWHWPPTCLSLLPRIPFITLYTITCTLKNITRQKQMSLEKVQRAYVTSHRPVNHTGNHSIPRVVHYKYFSCSGLLRTTPEKFENSGFTLKTHQLFFTYTASEEFKIQRTIACHFGFLCLRKTGAEN